MEKQCEEWTYYENGRSYKGGGSATRPRRTDSARVISVIETRILRGEGTEKDPCRIVTQYWDFEGNLLAENDQYEKEIRRGERNK